MSWIDTADHKFVESPMNIDYCEECGDSRYDHRGQTFKRFADADVHRVGSFPGPPETAVTDLTEVPEELLAILDERAGKVHSRAGTTVAALAEILAKHLETVPTQELVAELARRGTLPRCRCGRWQTYIGRWDTDGYTIRCHGCLKAIWKCRCR